MADNARHTILTLENYWKKKSSRNESAVSQVELLELEKSLKKI